MQSLQRDHNPKSKERFSCYGLANCQTFGGRMGGRPECSASDMLSSEEPSVQGPSARSDHRQCAAKDDEHNQHPEIAPTCDDDPKLDDRDEGTYRGRP